MTIKLRNGWQKNSFFANKKIKDNKAKQSAQANSTREGTQLSQNKNFN